MSNPNGDVEQSIQDEQDRENELLCLKIKAQLEEMFTDSHLAEDGFLLKHLQNKHGYVSLKLLTCLKKIKTLTTNWYMTLAAALSSELLEVNTECTKIRRRQPLPKWLLCSPTSRLLLIWNAADDGREEMPGEPPHHSLLLALLQRLGLSGSVASVWILRPGEELPKELQCYAKRHQELGQHVCTVVKFDRLEEVRRAYNALKAEEESANGEGLRVVAMGCKSMYNFTKYVLLEENGGKQLPEDARYQVNLAERMEEPTRPGRPSPAEIPVRSADSYESGEYLESSKHEEFFPGGSDHSYCGLSARYSKINMSFGDTNNECPWVLKRRFTARHLNASCLMQRVLRQPLGPDSEKGFNGRGRRDQAPPVPTTVDL